MFISIPSVFFNGAMVNLDAVLTKSVLYIVNGTSQMYFSKFMISSELLYIGTINRMYDVVLPEP